MQDAQTLKARIIALLDALPMDNLELLAEFAAFLQAKSDSYGSVESTVVREEKAETKYETAIEARQRPIQISSPRLLNREQIADFKLEVIEEANDNL